MRKKILVEVTFYSISKSAFPTSGYRPHFALPHSDYLMGVVFTGFAEALLDTPVLAEAQALYGGVDYSSLTEGQAVEIREGPHVVGHGVIL